MPGLVAEDKLTLGGGEHVRRDVALQLGSLQETINVSISDREAPPPPPPPAPSGRLAPPAPPPPPPPPPRQSVSQPDVDPCSQSPVGGCIRPPTKVRDVKPRYPQNRRGSKATVLLEGRVGTDGFLKDLRVLAPADAEFANAALAAVRQWQFTPTRLDGVPMEVRMRVTVNFFMDQ